MKTMTKLLAPAVAAALLGVALRSFTINRENIAWETAFSLFLILTSVVASFIFNTLRNEKEKAIGELEKIKTSATGQNQGHGDGVPRKR